MSTASRPRLGLSDTDPASERRIAAYRQMTVAERLARLEQLTGGMRRMSWQTRQHKRADLSLAERRRLWLAVQYGQDLADRVHAFCLARGRCC